MTTYGRCHGIIEQRVQPRGGSAAHGTPPDMCHLATNIIITSARCSSHELAHASHPSRGPWRSARACRLPPPAAVARRVCLQRRRGARGAGGTAQPPRISALAIDTRPPTSRAASRAPTAAADTRRIAPSTRRRVPCPPADRTAPRTAPRSRDDPETQAQRVVRLAAAARRQARQQRLHPVGRRGAARLARAAAAPLQPQDAAQAAARDGVAAAVQRGEGRGRPDRRHHGGADGHPAVARLLQHRGAAAAVRPVRLLHGLLRVHRAGRLPRRARRPHGHRVAADVPGGGRRGGEGHPAQLPGRAREAADGRARARLPHQLRVGPRVLRLHVGRGAHDRHVASQGPVRDLRVRDYVPAAVDLHLPQPARRLAVGPGARLHLHRSAAHTAETRHDQNRRRLRRRPQYQTESAHEELVADQHLSQRYNGSRDWRTRLLVRLHAGKFSCETHGPHPVGRAHAAAAALQLRARRQQHGRLRGHGVGAGLGAHRHPAHRAAGGHRHLQGVLGRAHHRRHAGDDRAGRGQRGQLLHAGLPRRRLAGALRRVQRLRRQDHLQRPVHRADGHPGSAILHAVLRVHTEGCAGGRHRVRHPVHGRIQRHQTDVASEETRSNTGRGHVHAVPDTAHRAGHPHGRHRQHHLHPVPRGAPQAVGGDAQDGARRGVPDDHARPLPHVPVRGLRAAARHQVRGQQLRARGAGVHAHLQRRLHRRQEHRAAHERLPRAPPAAVLLQRQAVRVLHLRGRGQARALRGVLRGRAPGPPAGRRRAPGAQQAAAAAARRRLTAPPVIRYIRVRRTLPGDDTSRLT